MILFCTSFVYMAGRTRKGGMEGFGGQEEHRVGGLLHLEGVAGVGGVKGVKGGPQTVASLDTHSDRFNTCERRKAWQLRLESVAGNLVA